MKLYGLMAEFDSPEAVLEAARRTRDAGYRKIDAYSPIPVEGLAEAIGFHWTILPYMVFCGGLGGGCAGFGMCWYANVISYSWNIGGKPFNSWPMWIAITFELTILGAALTAVIGMLALNGLPSPHHPTFNVERFARASSDRFFISIEATDRKFDLAQTKSFLESLRPHGVFEIED